MQRSLVARDQEVDIPTQLDLGVRLLQAQAHLSVNPFLAILFFCSLCNAQERRGDPLLSYQWVSFSRPYLYTHEHRIRAFFSSACVSPLSPSPQLH